MQWVVLDGPLWHLCWARFDLSPATIGPLLVLGIPLGFLFSCGGLLLAFVAANRGALGPCVVAVAGEEVKEKEVGGEAWRGPTGWRETALA